MSVFRRAADLIRLALAACLVAGPAAGPVWADPPRRVVSLNLCTDQLALMIADPGQLVSVSWHAERLAVRPLADMARSLHANHGLAEEIYRLQPDLVLTGPYTAPTTVAMLERLGVEPQSIFNDDFGV